MTLTDDSALSAMELGEAFLAVRRHTEKLA